MNIISKLSGGIGNQLFQYAFGLSLAKKFNANFHVNTESFINYTYHHDFELQKLIQGLSIKNTDDILSYPGNYLLAESSSVPSLNSIAVLPSDCSNLIVTGYWQNERYLNPDVIKEIYKSLKNIASRELSVIYDDINIFTNGIGVHIRRRDYAHMGLCSEEYYIGCLMALFDQNSNRQIFLFSDEPNYSMAFLRPYFGKNLTAVRSGSDWNDLYLMTIMHDLIISNSTFSWWGAYLNENKKDNIFCPDPWILVDSDVRPCPVRWHTIPNATHPKQVDVEIVQKIRVTSEKLIRHREY